MVRLVRHPQTKGPVTDRLHLNHRATSRLYYVFRLGSVNDPIRHANGRSLAAAGGSQMQGALR